MADTTPRARAIAAPAPLVALAVVLTACDDGAHASAGDRPDLPVVDTLHGVVFTDDYRWLEDQESPETRAWIAEQNAYAERVVGDSPLRARLEARLRELMDAPGAVFPRRAGDYEYFSLRKPGREVGAIFRRPAPPPAEDGTPSGPVDPEGEFEVVVDPLDLRADGTTSVAMLDFSPDGDLMLYAIRDGGRDEREIRVRALESGEDLPDRLPSALYGNVSFDREGEGFTYVHRSREIGGRVRYHRLGTPLADDEELFGTGHGPERFVGFSDGGEGLWRAYTVQHGWARTDVYLQDMRAGTAPVPLVVGAPARFGVRFVEDEVWLLTNLDAPRNRVLAVPLEGSEGANSDPAAWREVLPEAEDVLTGHRVIDGRIYADYLRNASSRIRVFELDGTRSSRCR